MATMTRSVTGESLTKCRERYENKIKQNEKHQEADTDNTKRLIDLHKIDSDNDTLKYPVNQSYNMKNKRHAKKKFETSKMVESGKLLKIFIKHSKTKLNSQNPIQNVGHNFRQLHSRMSKRSNGGFSSSERLRAFSPVLSIRNKSTEFRLKSPQPEQIRNNFNRRFSLLNFL